MEGYANLVIPRAFKLYLYPRLDIFGSLFSLTLSLHLLQKLCISTNNFLLIVSGIVMTQLLCVYYVVCSWNFYKRLAMTLSRAFLHAFLSRTDDSIVIFLSRIGFTDKHSYYAFTIGLSGAKALLSYLSKDISSYIPLKWAQNYFKQLLTSFNFSCP